MRKSLPNEIIDQLADLTVRKVAQLGFLGVGSDKIDQERIKIYSTGCLIEVSPCREDHEIVVSWWELERLFDVCEGIVMRLVDGRRTVEARGWYEGVFLTIRVFTNVAT